MNTCSLLIQIIHFYFYNCIKLGDINVLVYKM